MPPTLRRAPSRCLAGGAFPQCVLRSAPGEIGRRRPAPERGVCAPERGGPSPAAGGGGGGGGGRGDRGGRGGGAPLCAQAGRYGQGSECAAWVVVQSVRPPRGLASRTPSTLRAGRCAAGCGAPQRACGAARVQRGQAT